MNEAIADPVPIANLLRIAFYAGQLLDDLEQCEAAHDDGCHFVELLGSVLRNAALRIRRSGYLRGYHEETECSSRPRGRFLLAKSIATVSLAYGRLHHAFDEFSEDAPDNRVLKAAAQALLAEPARSHLASETLADLELVCADLRHVETCRLDARLLASVRPGPAARRYRPVRFVARILAERAQPDAEQGGQWTVQLAQDARRMRAVFERFVFRFARHHAPTGTRVHRRKYPWAHDAVRSADPRVPILQPDAVLRSSSSSRVVECKYTPRLLEFGPHDDIGRFRSSHLQQLFCYLAKEHQVGRATTGLMLYPRVGPAVRAETWLGDFSVTIATLDLSRPWRELIAELDSLLFASVPA